MLGKIEPDNDGYSRQRKHQIKYPERERARRLVREAIKCGLLERSDICDADYLGNNCIGPIQAAHYDYKDPYNIRWLCRYHHTQWDVARRNGTM